MADLIPNSPEWWVRHLCAKQLERMPTIARAEAYYSGQHALAYASEAFTRAFGGLFVAFADNWCETVVTAAEERLDVVGFRFGNTTDADDDAWDIWQENLLDSESHLAHTEAMVHGESYTLTWPVNGKPRITVEHPSQMITAEAPEDRRRRAAALKWYVDEDLFEVAYLYLPDVVYRYRSAERTEFDESSGVPILREWSPDRWVPDDREGTEDPAEQPNPFGYVPVEVLPNRPRMVAGNRSEIAGVIPLQDAINKLWADMLVASEYTADMQRYVLGYELEVDPESNQVQAPPWKRQDRLWVIPPNEPGEQPVSVGQFQAGDLDNYIKAIETAVQHVASQTRTPPHYLNPGADRMSGESIKSSESGLISKVRRKMVPFGEGWERTMRHAFFVLGDEERWKFTRAETVWRDPEIRSEAQLADAAIKRKELGVPLEQLWEDLGYTPTQIDRFRVLAAEEALLAPLPPVEPLEVPGA